MGGTCSAAPLELIDARDSRRGGEAPIGPGQRARIRDESSLLLRASGRISEAGVDALEHAGDELRTC